MLKKCLFSFTHSLRAAALSILFFSVSPGIAQNTWSTSNQQWVQDYFQIRLTDRFTVGADGGLRWKDAFMYTSQYVMRASAWYKLTDRLRVGAGLAHSGFFSNGDFAGVEWRPYEEISMDLKRKKITTAFRYRFEQRYYTDFNFPLENTNRLVLRNRVSAAVTFKIRDLKKEAGGAQLWFYLGDELFININAFDAVSVFDQNRFMAGPVLKFSDSFAVQLLYNMQVASSNKLTHVAWLVLRHNLVWKKAVQ
ncbi:MAG: DUF2490 domain-containing protein [Bacteroidetes bacterium]|nr:DUF2490 domain-containing protein [Bacteroidota bacterium]